MLEVRLTQSEIVSFNKVLRLNGGMIERTEVYPKGLVKIFESHGFQIQWGPPFGKNNPFEFGYFMGDHLNDNYGRNKMLANSTGVPMPEEVQAKDIFRFSKPVVAKGSYGHRGENKYLLETDEQKIKFAVFLRVCQRFGEIVYSDEIESEDDSFRELQRELDGSLSNAKVKPQDYLPMHTDWRFEEFIDCVSDYFAHLRIVVDGFGNIVYGALIRSNRKKGEQYLKIKKRSKNWQDGLYEHGILRMENLLIIPDSPLYLNSKAFMSYREGQSNEKILSEIPITHPTDRKIFKAHGINLNQPTVPSYLSKIATGIGILSRADYPYVGIDFIIDKDGKAIFLEANPGCELAPTAFGLEQDTKHEQVEVEVMKRMFESIGINANN